MNEYQSEQWDGQRLVLHHLTTMPSTSLLHIADQVAPYLAFRIQVDRFLDRHCSLLCTRSCFENRMSACCSKDGIITFWADMVVNAICSDHVALNRLTLAIQTPQVDRKCIYLGADGCIWRIRPLVCATFLCDKVKKALFVDNKELKRQWSDLNQLAKGYRWPDRPVLFDNLEKTFIDLGCRSPLMYLNNSPGLLRVKQKAGLK